MTTSPSLFDSLNEITNVSRETFETVELFVDLLLQWNHTINLVSKNTLSEIWQRHIFDSAQLLRYIPDHANILTDFGSGGGFPGIVLAMLRPWDTIHLVESDHRKAAFLTKATSLISSPVHIHNTRIETLTSWKSDVITARALAPVDGLLDLLFPFIEKSKLSLFLKGQNVVEELSKASTSWDIGHQLHPSMTNPNAYILDIQHVRRR